MPTVYVKSTRPSVPMTCGTSSLTSAAAAAADTAMAPKRTAAGPMLIPATRTDPTTAPIRSRIGEQEDGLLDEER